MTIHEQALTAVLKEIIQTIDMIADITDEDDARRYRGEWLRCKMYLAKVRLAMAADHEAVVDAEKEIRVLDGYDDE